MPYFRVEFLGGRERERETEQETREQKVGR